MLSKFSGKEVPLIPGGLRVYRSWRWQVGGELRAVNFNYIWGPGLNVASCRKGEYMDLPFTFATHGAPEAGCACGFYGSYQPTYNGQFWGRYDGVVEMSGRIILGTEGARAERARIVAATTAHHNSIAVENVISAYPDVKFFSAHEDMIKEFPPQDISELVPPSRLVMRNAYGDIIIQEGASE